MLKLFTQIAVSLILFVVAANVAGLLVAVLSNVYVFTAVVVFFIVLALTVARRKA